MTGTGDDGTWEYRVHSGLFVRATRRESDGTTFVVEVGLEIDPDVDGIRLRTRNVTVTYMADKTSVRPTLDLPAIEHLVERWANEPANALRLLDTREPNAHLQLLGVQDRGKRHDWFYIGVLFARRECEQHGLPYAETIAKYNNVEPGTVYRWINEAKRRGLRIYDNDGTDITPGVERSSDDEPEDGEQ